MERRRAACKRPALSIVSLPAPLEVLSTPCSNLGANVVAQSCLYAILSHRSGLALVRPLRNCFALLSEISSNGALRY
jgi:hypothetical protein